MFVQARRMLVLMGLMFWQGGFTFYAGVVVPVGTHVLKPPASQSQVTDPVTDLLNIAGVLTLLVLFWDMLAGPGTASRLRLQRWVSWLSMAGGLVVLFVLHPRLHEQMTAAPSAHELMREPNFYLAHRIYLWTSALQWVCCVWWLAVTLLVWQEKREEKTVPL